ncbi:MAG: GlsB/YeaQ/YmgE family stress response membrane protein [Chloroflexota bacterium]
MLTVGSFSITFGQLVVWLIIGAIAGALAARVVSGRKRRFSDVSNIVLGLLGALVGGFLFSALNINIASDVVISANDLISAFVGSVLLLGILYLVQR